HAAIDFFREHDVAFELKAQLWADAERQPIEDASVDWPISVSPYRTVAARKTRAQCGPVWWVRVTKRAADQRDRRQH
ncbi:hypothetical protein MKK75_20275, partial [Methylobacterium sp. J-030]|nr:hypothetical protein [Methylobacterium sp. J-030]